MQNPKISHPKQTCSAYTIRLEGGSEDGKRGVLVHCGPLEVLFNASNALDIVYVRYRGVNLSFLSKNGLNDNRRDFASNFEGGFLYTCGLDNISTCVEGAPVHGSLHYKKAESLTVSEGENEVKVSAVIRDTVLFGKNLIFRREYTVTPEGISVSDWLENAGTRDVSYALLYHTNFGYPFLDEGLRMEIPALHSDPLTGIAKEREEEKFRITKPIDNNPEDVYYHTMKEGRVTLENRALGIRAKLLYSTEDFPVTLEWKSMATQDYALGIEPAVTRFDDFRPRTIRHGESVLYRVNYVFEAINDN